MSSTGSLENSLLKIHRLLGAMIKIGLYVQIISSVRDSGDHFYYLKVYRIGEFCDLCRKYGKDHNGDHRLEIEHHSIYNHIHPNPLEIFSDLLDVYKFEKRKLV